MSGLVVEAYGLIEANHEAAVGFQDNHEAQMDENLVETDDSGEQDNHEAQIDENVVETDGLGEQDNHEAQIGEKLKKRKD